MRAATAGTCACSIISAVNLHTVWDSGILRIDEHGRRVVDYADALNAEITPELTKKWEAGTPADWANKSHGVAVDTTYAGVPAGGAPPMLDQKYVDRGGRDGVAASAWGCAVGGGEPSVEGGRAGSKAGDDACAYHAVESAAWGVAT